MICDNQRIIIRRKRKFSFILSSIFKLTKMQHFSSMPIVHQSNNSTSLLLDSIDFKTFHFNFQTQPHLFTFHNVQFDYYLSNQFQ